MGLSVGGKKALVEGVETEKQAEELRRLGVDYIQGYSFARPMPQDQFVAFMTEQNASEAHTRSPADAPRASSRSVGPFLERRHRIRACSLLVFEP